jgi:hypothetical protein
MLALLALVGLTQACRAAEGAIQDLLKRLPDSTNVLVVADVEGLRKALGVAPGTRLASADAPSLPATGKRLVLGANIDLTQHRHQWSVAICQLERKLSIRDIALTEKVPAEKIADRDVVPSERNAYFVELGPDLLACRTPANRQELKRWLSFQQRNPLPAIPEYLLQAASPAEPAVVIMAVELADSLDRTAVRRGLDLSQVLAGKQGVDFDGVAKVIASARGAKLVVKAGKPLHGELTIDFNTNTDALRAFSKPLLLEVLQHVGLYVPDFDSWDVVLRERALHIDGRLSLNSMRKFAALVATPVPSPEAANLATYQSENPQQRMAVASQRYYKSIDKMLADLRDKKAQAWRGLGSWYDRYADQIGMLPVLDVDPKLLAFGQATAEYLRSVATAMKGVAQTQRVARNSSLYGPWGGAVQLADGTVVSLSRVQYTLSAQAAGARDQAWESINNETSKIRQEMTQKYRVEF